MGASGFGFSLKPSDLPANLGFNVQSPRHPFCQDDSFEA
jgi:hypothetical protein